MFSFRLAAVIGAFILAVMVFGSVNTVRADDVSESAVMAGVGQAAGQQFTHEDADPFKGWFNLTVENSGQDPWTDFHFEIIQLPNQGNIENVSFLVDPPYEPTSSQSPINWIVDNDVVGATLDLYFADDPIMPGETGVFNVYTENVDQVSFFGLFAYPTPEPATVGLLIAGGLLMLRRKPRAA